MRPRIGTSGRSYDAWKGAFHPEKIGSSAVPGYYAPRLSALAETDDADRDPPFDVFFFKYHDGGVEPSLAGRMLEAPGGRP